MPVSDIPFPFCWLTISVAQMSFWGFLFHAFCRTAVVKCAQIVAWQSLAGISGDVTWMAWWADPEPAWTHVTGADAPSYQHRCCCFTTWMTQRHYLKCGLVRAEKDFLLCIIQSQVQSAAVRFIYLHLQSKDHSPKIFSGFPKPWNFWIICPQFLKVVIFCSLSQPIT